MWRSIAVPKQLHTLPPAAGYFQRKCLLLLLLWCISLSPLIYSVHTRSIHTYRYITYPCMCRCIMLPLYIYSLYFRQSPSPLHIFFVSSSTTKSTCTSANSLPRINNGDKKRKEKRMLVYPFAGWIICHHFSFLPLCASCSAHYV